MVDRADKDAGRVEDGSSYRWFEVAIEGDRVTVRLTDTDMDVWPTWTGSRDATWVLMRALERAIARLDGAAAGTQRLKIGDPVLIPVTVDDDGDMEPYIRVLIDGVRCWIQTRLLLKAKRHWGAVVELPATVDMDEDVDGTVRARFVGTTEGTAFSYWYGRVSCLNQSGETDEVQEGGQQ